MPWMRGRTESLLFWVSVALLAAGAVAMMADASYLSDTLWTAGAVLGLVASLGWTLAAARRREATVDVIAVLALAGALLVGEPFAGAVITVMLASGRLLEARASARARRELGLLAARVPRWARLSVAGAIREVPVDAVGRGDRLLVGTGEVLPVDGRLLENATLDESALTGEPLPVERAAGEHVRSGAVNAGPPIGMLATARAAESTYAQVVRLVEQAQASSAPFVRTADRVAVVFVPVTLAVAASAWLFSGDPVRAVAVLVVATPCPLLLAAPIAIMSGLSRAARSGVVIKGGAALEGLARGTVILFDKTGTLTRGQPTLTGIVTGPGWQGPDLLRLAASLDQVSPHVLASALVRAAADRDLALTTPTDLVEEHGQGLRGQVLGHELRVGKASWVARGPVPAWAGQARRRADLESCLVVFVGVDGLHAGALLFADPIRPDAPRMVRALRGAGIHRVVLVTGDRADTAEVVGRIVGVDTVLADCEPADKLSAILAESDAATTIMVGDGVNDAPALAAAGVGVALAARGTTASSETADVVLTVDRIDALGDAILIARRSRSTAVQAVGVGMGLSAVAMTAAAVGLLPPAAGAILQEVIDLLAILLALRALLPGPTHTIRMPAADIALAHRLRSEHDAVLDIVEQCRTVADSLSETAPDLVPVRALSANLDNRLLPHERADEALLVPLVARVLGSANASTALTRTHAEIEHQAGRLRRMLADLDDATAAPEDVIELRRLLYGLYAILTLHNAQEEEEAFSLVPEGRSADLDEATRLPWNHSRSRGRRS
jgi:heavy metal translocating P-type ATPase